MAGENRHADIVAVLLGRGGVTAAANNMDIAHAWRMHASRAAFSLFFSSFYATVSLCLLYQHTASACLLVFLPLMSYGGLPPVCSRVLLCSLGNEKHGGCWPSALSMSCTVCL